VFLEEGYPQLVEDALGKADFDQTMHSLREDCIVNVCARRDYADAKGPVID